MTEDISVRKVKSAVRTVELLEYLAARRDEPARLREISDALAMPRSSTHALLRTLVGQGWVRSDNSGTLYGIGIRALLVGTSYLDGDPYLPLITPSSTTCAHNWTRRSTSPASTAPTSCTWPPASPSSICVPPTASAGGCPPTPRHWQGTAGRTVRP